MKVSEAFLEVRPSNLAAIRLYQRLPERLRFTTLL